MNYDIVIPCAQKDYIKLRYCLDSIYKFINPEPDNIYIVSKDRLSIDSCISILDSEAIDIDVTDIQYRRPAWIYQQIVKMCQNFTKNDTYFCIDADLVFLKPFELFVENKPVYFISSHTQNHLPYFSFMKKVWNLDKIVDHSFICDITLFNKKILRELIPDENWLLEVCNQFLEETCLIGEPEIYGNYLAKKYPNSYLTKNVKVSQYGIYMPELWTKAQIEFLLEKENKLDSDIAAFHSWT